MSDINRLRSVLVSSGLQSKDNALYQVINELIAMVGNISGGGSGGGSAGSVGDNIAYTDKANVFIEDQQISKSIPVIKLNFTGSTLSTRFGQITPAGIEISNNLHYNGTSWNKDNTASPGSVLFVTSDGGMAFYGAPAGANPASLGMLFATSASGQISERGRGTPMGEWFAYSSSWASSVGNAGIGTFNSGSYMLIGNTCFFRIRVDMGPGSQIPLGIWGFSLPFAVSGSANNFAYGSAYFSTSTGVVYSGTVIHGGWAAGNLIGYVSMAINGGFLSNTYPAAWAATTYMFMQGCYQI